MKDAVPFCYTKEPIISKEAYGPGLIYVWSDDSEDSGFESSFDHRQYASGGFIQDITLDMDMAQANSVVDTLKVSDFVFLVIYANERQISGSIKAPVSFLLVLQYIILI